MLKIRFEKVNRQFWYHYLSWNKLQLDRANSYFTRLTTKSVGQKYDYEIIALKSELEECSFIF